jgi:hypothetical protein
LNGWRLTARLLRTRVAYARIMVAARLKAARRQLNTLANSVVSQRSGTDEKSASRIPACSPTPTFQRGHAPGDRAAHGKKTAAGAT